MTDRSAAADAHAYVDNCLSAEARRAFEARLDADPALRRRVETWQAQNEAIRAAYGVPASNVGRTAGEAPSWMPSQIVSRRASLGLREPLSGAAPGRTLAPGRYARPRPRAKASPSLRLGLVLALSIGLLTFSGRGGPADPRGGLGEAGLSAFRAFGDNSTANFDFVPEDARALAKWLSPRFGPPAPEAGLEIPGWRPLGVRLVPGTVSAAAFIVWETPEASRAGLLVEALDAPADYPAKARAAGGHAIAAWTSGGRGYAAVAPAPLGVEALTRVGEGSGAAR